MFCGSDFFLNEYNSELNIFWTSGWIKKKDHFSFQKCVEAFPLLFFDDLQTNLFFLLELPAD